MPGSIAVSAARSSCSSPSASIHPHITDTPHLLMPKLCRSALTIDPGKLGLTARTWCTVLSLAPVFVAGGGS